MFTSSRVAVRGLLALWLLQCCLAFSLSPAWAAGPSTVSGVFKGNGKEAKLAFVSVHKGEPLAGKPTTMLVFTEKDHSKEAQPQVKAMFGGFGSGLIITIDETGEVVGCEVAHAAHAKQGFSSIGKVQLSDFKRAGGVVQGRLKTNGEVKSVGELWQLDITFSAAAK